MDPPDKLLTIITALQELESDTTLPKNIKTKLATTIKLLTENAEQSIKVSRALHALESLGDDSNVPSFTRTQVFNIVSMLEVV